MARELILMPKIKYEGLLEKLDQNMKPNATNIVEGQKINSAPVNDQTCDSCINNLESSAKIKP